MCDGISHFSKGNQFFQEAATVLEFNSKLYFTISLEKTYKVSYTLLNGSLGAFELKGFNRGEFIMGQGLL